MIPRHILLLLLFFIPPLGVIQSQGQEIIVPLSENPSKRMATFPLIQTEKSQPSPVLSLPFWDDFSYKGPYPDGALWADNDVFVNSSLAVHPKTFGVATFDALNEHGVIYEHMDASNTPHVADKLTSHPIRLDSLFAPQARALSPADSVILSFYYQPQGMAGNPTRHDTLILQFLRTPAHYASDHDGDLQWIEDHWETVWKAEGQDLSTFSNDTFPYFKRVAIAIADPAFFRDDFRFRFVNHVSFPIPGNPTLQNNTGSRAIWNIDYVYLHAGRRITQTNYFDIAFAAPPQSMLRHYTSMPWTHYIANPSTHLRNNFSMRITNLDNTIYPYSYRYFIRDENGNNIRNYSGGTWNIAPFSTHGYQQYQPHAEPIIMANPLPVNQAAERYFDVVHVIRLGIAGDNRPRNDTVSYRQYFGNYFAYDDGVPEAGYGVTGRFPRIAKRFVAAKPDQVNGIDIFFNRTIRENNAGRAFKITIWESLAPEEKILYQSDDNLFTDFSEGMNQFVHFALERGVQVTDTFYVGIEQQGVVGIEGFISIGYDANNNAGSHIYYNSGSEWMRSIYQGALMIRPFVGSQKSNDDPQPEQTASTPTIYPNPVAGSLIHININDNINGDTPPVRMEIIDVYGRIIYSGNYRSSFETGSMKNGIYFLRIIYPGGKVPETSPFLISR